MYPAQALFDGLYSYQDLPDTVLGTGIFGDENVVMSRLTPPQPSIDSSGTSYYRGFSLDGGLVGIGLREGDEWVGTEVRNEDAEFGECLISRLPPDTSGTIADQFANSYTITLDGGESAVVTRQSICQWTAEIIDEEGTLVTWELVYLSLNDPENPNNYKWLISVQGLTTVGGVKNDPQNSPVGDYFAASIFYAASVS